MVTWPETFGREWGRREGGMRIHGRWTLQGPGAEIMTLAIIQRGGHQRGKRVLKGPPPPSVVICPSAICPRETGCVLLETNKLTQPLCLGLEDRQTDKLVGIAYIWRHTLIDAQPMHSSNMHSQAKPKTKPIRTPKNRLRVLSIGGR